ncbi:hypothetical protein Ga0061068_1232 [Tepidiphilus thermophilus]|uniref:Mechanosensitive ion channel MscS C-terminal domain-containing protein n=1 Tax=Tepidiphilus thermophilus TaxID=876478 RepID=A0A0K6IYL6_9PROT|nr:hypothetical protein Ga0061068_1232 [Tepidiphilus thermophilus]
MLRQAFAELLADEAMRRNVLSEELMVDGVTELADSAVNIRVRIKTLPGAQWAVGRAFNTLVKKHFDAAGIEMPFPHLTVYFGQDKDGSAPPVRVVLQGEQGIGQEEGAGPSGQISVASERTQVPQGAVVNK